MVNPQSRGDKPACAAGNRGPASYGEREII
jgi:hypothetical protein